MLWSHLAPVGMLWSHLACVGMLWSHALSSCLMFRLKRLSGCYGSGACQDVVPPSACRDVVPPSTCRDVAVPTSAFPDVAVQPSACWDVCSPTLRLSGSLQSHLAPVWMFQSCLSQGTLKCHLTPEKLS